MQKLHLASTVCMLYCHLHPPVHTLFPYLSAHLFAVEHQCRRLGGTDCQYGHLPLVRSVPKTPVLPTAANMHQRTASGSWPCQEEASGLADDADFVESSLSASHLVQLEDEGLCHAVQVRAVRHMHAWVRACVRACVHLTHNTSYELLFLLSIM